MKGAIHIATQRSEIRAPHKKLHKIQNSQAKLDSHLCVFTDRAEIFTALDTITTTKSVFDPIMEDRDFR
jgi:hypothetical protein